MMHSVLGREEFYTLLKLLDEILDYKIKESTKNKTKLFSLDRLKSEFYTYKTKYKILKVLNALLKVIKNENSLELVLLVWISLYNSKFIKNNNCTNTDKPKIGFRKVKSWFTEDDVYRINIFDINGLIELDILNTDDIFEYDTIILKWKYEKILKNNIISKSYISDFYPPKDFYYKLPMFMNLSIYLKGSCDHTTINIYNKIDTKNNIHTTILNLFIDDVIDGINRIKKLL